MKLETKPRGRPPKYPWDDWLDPARGRRLLQPGIDFDRGTSVETIRKAFLRRARERDLLVHTFRYGPGLGVEFLGGRPQGKTVDLSGCFDGELHVFTQVVDFNHDQADLVASILREAYSRGIDVRTQTSGMQVAMRAILDEPAREAPAETERGPA